MPVAVEPVQNGQRSDTLQGEPVPVKVISNPPTFDWRAILSAILAGGIAGQIVATFGGDWFTRRREHEKWLVAERQKLFSELLATSTYIPKIQPELDGWTYKIRDASQRLHVLYPTGTAPDDLAQAIEEVFQLARHKKDGTAPPDWTQQFRDRVRDMRVAMAAHLRK